MRVSLIAIVLAACASSAKSPPEAPAKPVETASPAASPAVAQAAAANDAGKQMMYSQHFAEATAKFREATTLDPLAIYFYNLCTALFQQGMFRDALAACNTVKTDKPPAALDAKTDKLIGMIRDEGTRQNIDLK